MNKFLLTVLTGWSLKWGFSVYCEVGTEFFYTVFRCVSGCRDLNPGNNRRTLYRCGFYELF